MRICAIALHGRKHLLRGDFATLTPRRPQDFNNITAEKSTSALDHRNRLTYTAVYDVPLFQHDHNWFKHNIIGNFKISGERMPRAIGVTRADALYPSSKPFWKE